MNYLDEINLEKNVFEFGEHQFKSGIRKALGNVRDSIIGEKKFGTCPRCGGELLIRTNRKEGRRFYACSNYKNLNCRYTKPLDEYI